mgnify:CR=1
MVVRTGIGDAAGCDAAPVVHERVACTDTH